MTLLKSYLQRRNIIAFECPTCLKNTLHITTKIELPPDNRSDEITLQLVKCTRCALQAIAIYEESRRGALDSELWNHTGYQVDDDALKAVTQAIKQCPSPSNPNCQCQPHRTLEKMLLDRSWQGVNTTSFSMKLG